MTDLNKEKEFEQEAAAAEDAQAAEETAEAAEAQCEEECTDACDEEACAEAEDAEGSAEPKTWAEKKAAKKAAKQNKQEEAYKEQIAQLEDKVLRQMAEFENFRKRTEREKQSMFEMGAKNVIEKILPVVDNFERGFATVDPEDENDAFVGGMRMVYKQLMQELENMGVKPIEAVGQEFDPNLHNAVMQMESEEYESGFVAQELLKGYTYHDTVVRYSMVAVVP